MERRCESCGKTYETRSPRSRFCGSTCRSRAFRGQPGAGLVALPAPQGPVAGGELVRSVEKELRDVDRLDSFLGQAAVDIARRIEGNGRAPLSQVAAAHRELRAAVAEAKKGAHQEKSALQKRRDELAARRAKRQA